jgi:hypothetical protein
MEPIEHEFASHHRIDNLSARTVSTWRKKPGRLQLQTRSTAFFPAGLTPFPLIA